MSGWARAGWCAFTALGIAVLMMNLIDRDLAGSIFSCALLAYGLHRLTRAERREG